MEDRETERKKKKEIIHREAEANITNIRDTEVIK